MEDSAAFAVLVPLIAHAGESCVLLTKRPDTMSRYAGQVAFPGGAREPQDADLMQTALRETEEEVGIPPEAIEIVRELDCQQTTLGHRIKPFVGRVKTVVRLRLDPHEVERALFLPLRQITPDLFRVRSHVRLPDGVQVTVYTFDFDGCEVWGLTARILRSAFIE